jgi:capsid portal protein
VITGKLNTLFLGDLEIYLVELSLKGPDFGDPLETAKVLVPFVTAGAAAPNDLRDLLGRVLGKDLEMFPDEYNVPLQVMMQNLKPAIPGLPIAMQKAAGGDLINLLKDLRDVLEEMQGS